MAASNLLLQLTSLLWLLLLLLLASIPCSHAYASATIKDLKQMIIDHNLNERGLMTKLKKKQDYVDFLTEKLGSGTIDPSVMRSDDAEISMPAGIGDVETSDIDEEMLHRHDDGIESTPTALAMLPPDLRQKLQSKDMNELLPIQSAAFKLIFEGNDAVLSAPTGSGKTLAFALPLVAALGKRRLTKIAAPQIVVLVPSRELARQIGREFEKLLKKTGSKASSQVATVFGGVPLERHIFSLKSKPQIVVSTPGRMRELVRQGHMNYSQVKTFVLDEADALLDRDDSPDVRAILDDITQEVGERDDPTYQLLLVSATVNKFVRNFATEIMELSEESDSFITVKGEAEGLVSAANTQTAGPTVEHWHTSCKTSFHPSITADLVSVLNPKLSVVFVKTKSDTETVANLLRAKLVKVETHVLHGDMPQAARSKTIANLRATTSLTTSTPQILVATDVASRGLDLSNVDFVIQHGMPRISGRDGTYNTELYTHRTGRAGRVGMSRNANAILLYDPTEGEGKFIPDLVKEVGQSIGKQIRPRPIPSTQDIVEASYDKVTSDCLEAKDSKLSEYFLERLKEDVDVSDPKELLLHLSKAMATLSQVDASVSPANPHCSLLTGDTSQRTLRAYRLNDKGVSPPEVTKFCKEFGSGKLGRIVIRKDGSAVFDMSRKKAERLLNAIQSTEEELHGWAIEMPMRLAIET